MRGGVAIAVTAVLAATIPAHAAPARSTPFPPIAAKKTQCPKILYKLSGRYEVTVVVAAEQGRHPSAAALTCHSAYGIALAGKKHFLKPPFRTGETIEVAGATYTAAVGGPDVWPPASGPVYGWFGNGIEVLLMIASGG